MEIHPKNKRKLPTILIAVTLIGQLHDDVILLLPQNPLMHTRGFVFTSMGTRNYDLAFCTNNIFLGD